MDIKSKIRKLFVEAGTPDNGDAFQKRLFSVKDKLGEPSLSSSTRASAAANLRLAEKAFKAGDQAEAKKWLDKAEKLLKPTGGSLGASTSGPITRSKQVNIVKSYDEIIQQPKIPQSWMPGAIPTSARSREEDRVLESFGSLFENIFTNFESLRNNVGEVERKLSIIDEKEGTTNLSRFRSDYKKLVTDVVALSNERGPRKSKRFSISAVNSFYERVRYISGEVSKTGFPNSFYKIYNAPENTLNGEIWNYTPKKASIPNDQDDMSNDQVVSGMAASEVGKDIGNSVPVVLDPDDPEFTTK